MVAEHKHYLPILKVKAGELWALNNLSGKARPRVTPILELTELPAGKSITDHIAAQCQRIVEAWGTTQGIYLDTRWLHPGHGDPAVLDVVFTTARSAGLKSMPVAYPSFSLPSLDQLARIISTDGRGCMVRATRDVLSSGLIPLVANSLGQPISQLDLLLDYRTSPMSLRDDTAHVHQLKDWRLFAAASGVFPSSLSSLPQATWVEIERNCWESWYSYAGVRNSLRSPAFSDYTIRDPGRSASGGNPPVTMRYTANSHWLAQVHGRVQDGESENMIAICRDLVENRQEWCGGEFSAGDSQIKQISLGKSGTGSAPQWVQWAMNHHIEFVVTRQLSE